jgi:phosphoserine phosphatase
VQWFARELGVTALLGTDLNSDGTISHVWKNDKADWLRHLMMEHALPLNRVAAVGDTVLVVPMLQAAGLPFFVGARVPPELEWVIHVPGADLRVIADQILAAWAGTVE